MRKNDKQDQQSARPAVAAQAFHWADPAIALPQIRRILKPNSMFTTIWNNRTTENSEVVAWTEEAIHRHVPSLGILPLSAGLKKTNPTIGCRRSSHLPWGLRKILSPDRRTAVLLPIGPTSLGKTIMTAFQASFRGGVVIVKVEHNRVRLGGRAVTVLRGELV